MFSVIFKSVRNRTFAVRIRTLYTSALVNVMILN